MAEEIITSPEESVSMEAPIVESPIDVQEDVVDVEPNPSKGLQNLQKLHSLLVDNDVYSKITPERFDDFVEKYRDPIKLKKLHSLLVENDVYSQIMPADLNEAADKYGFGGLGKPSAVPSASVGGGSATKGRGVEQPSTLPQKSSEASLDNIQKTMQVYADGQGAFPETLSAADVKELRKQVPGGELPNISDDKVAKMLAGKSPKQVRIASVNAIPDIKERKTEQARMYKDFSREKSAENQQLDQNITALTQGLEQIKAEGENLQQQLQNPNIDSQTASMLSEQLQQTQANYNQAASDYNDQLNKYQQNARFIKTMGAGVQSNLKGLIPSTIINPRSPSDVMAASTWNATAPALLKTLGAVIDVLPSPLPTDRNVVSDAIFNLADKVSVDVAKYSPQANVSLMDDVNVYNTSQLLGNLLGSVAMTFGGGAAAGATGAQAAGFSQVYGDIYKQGRDAGLTKAESMFFAMPTGIVAAYLGDKGVESLAGAFSKTSLKSAIKQGAKELAEKRTPQMMMEFGKKVLLNTLEGAAKEGLQEGAEFTTEFGSKKLASLKEDVKFKDDLSLEGFGKGLAESVIAGAAGGGLLGPFFGAGRNKAFADVVNKAARDPEAEIDFMEQLDASVVANDITPEQKQQMVEMLEKTKQAAATVPPVVESEPARAEATALVLEQQDLEQQIEQTNPAMAKPLQDRLDEVNNRLGEIAEGKNLPTEEAPQTLPEVENAIANLREQEQAENEAIDPNDEVAKKEIYDKYDEVITPLLEQEKELKAQAPVAEEAKGESGVEGDVESYKGMFNPKKTGISGLDGLLEDDGYNYFYKGVSGEVVMMSPDAYLKKVRDDITRSNTDLNVLDEKKASIIEGINKGDKINMPYLSLKENGQAHKQEGRNRAVVARERGEKLIPVFIEKDISFDDKIAKGQEYINTAIKDGATNKQEVLDKLKEQGLHRDAIRFIDQNFDDKEVEQSLPTQEAKGEEKVSPLEAAKESISKRVQGDKLLDAQDLADELNDNKAEIDNDGMVTIYHRTTPENKKEIESTGKMKGLEDGVFFSTKETGQNEGYGESIVKLKVPIESIQIDDTFGDEAHVRIPTKKAGQIIDVKKYLPTLQAETTTPTSEQAPQAFPAQEGVESVEDKFQANAELEQIYRDLQAAVNKNVDKDTIRMLKEKPTEAMVDKALRELQRKGIIEIDCN